MNEFDVVVVGSGVGGLTAAVVAAQHGLTVLVVEKASVFGGTTAYSGGAAWIPGNHLMKSLGLDDSREAAVEYLRGVLGNLYDAGKIEAFLDNAPAMLRYMEANTQVRFDAIPLPDYRPELPGARRFRSVLVREYDGRRLGARLEELRRPLRELTLFGSMQIAGADVHPLRKAFRTRQGFSHAAKLFGRFLVQLVRHGRGTRLVSGNALAARLLRSALDAGVTVWNRTPAVRLILGDGKVTGIVVERAGEPVSLTCRKAVVLASGGFGADADMRMAFMPLPAGHLSMQPEENVGDGIRMGVVAGGEIVADNPSNGIWSPVSAIRRADGTLSKFPHILIDRYMPGSIAVDPAGRRFVNEGDSYQSFVAAMHNHGYDKVHMIADRRFLRTYGMGLARPAPFPVRRWIESGYLIEAATIAGLAGRIGAEPAVLEETIRTFNRYAEAGEDPDFARGADAHSRFRGDPDHRPNPSLGPIRHAPFYALALHPGDLSSVAGLNTDAATRVLDRAGRAIDGLYAVGLDMNSMTRGLYPAGGASIGPAMTFAYIAARAIAGAAGHGAVPADGDGASDANM